MPGPSDIFKRAVEETMAGCGHEGFHTFNGVYGGDGKPIERVYFDAKAKLAEIDAEMAQRVIPQKVG